MTIPTEWPEMVPVFQVKDIRKRSYQFGGHDHSILDILMTLFNPLRHYDSVNVTKAATVLHKVIGGRSIVEWSEDERTTKREIADALNETMRKLGYTEVVEL